MKIITDSVFQSLGYVAGVAFSASWPPQIYRSYKNKCMDDFSWITLSVLIFAISCMDTYGIYFSLYPIYVPGLLQLIFVIVLLCQKIYYDVYMKNKNSTLVVPMLD
jgi:uncharacterized protein with PQ loop repeat